MNKKQILTFLIASALGMTTLISLGFNQDIIKIEKSIENKSTPSNAIKKEEIISTPSNAKEKNTYTGFKTIGEKVIYLNKGKRILDSFKYINGELYYFDEFGYMRTGWFLDKETNKQYYFGDNGISETGWIFYENNWYYLDNYECVTGWKEIISDSGDAYWFCFNEDGIMYFNCKTPDGYYVNEDGVWIPDNEPEVKGYDEDNFKWENKPTDELGQLSGLIIADHPAEFYMLCIAGETSGLSNLSAVKNGDRGCAYGACQLDYRYDLVGFMKFAYEKHPDLWPGFKPYLNYKNGNPELKGNSIIGNTFIEAMTVDYETAMSDQLEYMSMRYWDNFSESMNAAGFDLDNRHIAVSAALFSVNVNCGPQANIFIRNLSPDMTDEEMIKKIYNLRNTVFARQKVGSAFKGTTKRYKQSEPQMALDLLYGYTTIDSDINYGGGVEWHGNPFIDAITTIPSKTRILYDEPVKSTKEYVESTPGNANKSKKISIKKSEEVKTEEIIEEVETLMETESIEETQEIIETEIYDENNENLVQLEDGSWVDKAKYGPGYQYMETEEIKEILPEETLPIETIQEETIPEDIEKLGPGYVIESEELIQE